MLCSRRNVGGLVLNINPHRISVRNLCGTADDDPVFGPVVMQLERETGSGVHHDAFHLKAFTHVEAFVVSPWTKYTRVQTSFGASGGVESGNDILDLLERFAWCHQYGVFCFDNGQIIGVQGRNQTM